MSYHRTPKYERQWHPKPVVPAGEQRPAPVERPDVCIRITVERFDVGEPETHVMELRAGKRRDSHRAFVDGTRWMPRIGGRVRRTIGLSLALAGIRKALPRTLSARHCEE